MLTKTLRFDEKVLEILKTMDWRDEGKLGILTSGQLDRKMYTDVNKALDAMGGKWNRGLGGHVFKLDPREQVEGLLGNGELVIEKDGFFETPELVVKRMFELAEPLNNSYVLEPSAGLGAIAEHLCHYYDEEYLYLIEKNVERANKLKSVFTKSIVACGDFLDFANDQKFKRIYMNPPFENLQDIDHVQHAYKFLSDDGIMVSVMAESAFFREDKKSVAFREWLTGYGVIGYSEKLPEGAFKSSGTMVNARLVVIKK